MKGEKKCGVAGKYFDFSALLFRRIATYAEAA